MEKEIWKDIKGFEGRFQISNFGRVKRLAYICEYTQTNQYRKPKKAIKKFNEKIYKKRRNKGRNSVNIDGKDYYVYRLVASNFIRPLLKGEEVNHKDGNKMNDYLDNLEIVSRIENQNHAFRNNLTTVGGLAIRVEIDGKIFNSVGEASRYFNISKSVILQILRNPNYNPYKKENKFPYSIKRV